MREYIGGDLIKATSPRGRDQWVEHQSAELYCIKINIDIKILFSLWWHQYSCYIPECEKLLQRMLVIDPEKRLTMKEITNNKWMKLDGDDEDFQKLIADSLEPIDEADEPLNEMVMQHMEGLGIDRESTVEVRGHVQW